MYDYFRGKVMRRAGNRVTLDVQGIGYEVHVGELTQRTLRDGMDATLYIHLHLAEGVMALYGFADDGEREMFRKLLTVSRVGPKLALAVLSRLTPGDIVAAVATDNASAFDGVSGMGKKTAARVILELRESVGSEWGIASAATAAGHADMQAEAVAALVALGYDGLSATRTVSSLRGEAESVESLLRLALKKMAK
ncbi:MAG: Holliday junction branch migration protein RuvA [Clostridiales bacterium]|nr:Holliday junction branch migration protein RuvA [Clostridiales bacterium]